MRSCCQDPKVSPATVEPTTAAVLADRTGVDEVICLIRMGTVRTKNDRDRMKKDETR